MLDWTKRVDPPLHWQVYKLLIRCDLVGGEGTTGVEKDGVGFSGRAEMPPLLTQRVGAAEMQLVFAHLDDPYLSAHFD